MTPVDLLTYMPALRALPLPQLIRIAEQSVHLLLRDGAPYLHAYLDPPPAVYLLSGIVTARVPNGQSPALEYPALPGEWVYLNRHLVPSLLRPQEANQRVTLTVHQAAEIVEIPSALLLNAAQSNPEFAMRIAQICAKQSERQLEMLSYFLHNPVPQRLLYLLRFLALHIYHEPSFRLPYPQPLMAQMVGCSREALSRALGTLAKEGAISIQKRVITLL